MLSILFKVMTTLKYYFVIFCLGTLFVGLDCYGQKEVQYKDWAGDMSELIHYEIANTSLRMSIISYETKDTSCLVIASMNDEVRKIIAHLEAYRDADDCWVYKEPSVPGVFSVHVREPYPEDTTMRANYVQSVKESKMLKNPDQ